MAWSGLGASEKLERVPVAFSRGDYLVPHRGSARRVAGEREWPCVSGPQKPRPRAHFHSGSESENSSQNHRDRK